MSDKALLHLSDKEFGQAVLESQAPVLVDFWRRGVVPAV